MAGIQSYRRKPCDINAILLTKQNLHDAAEWCGGVYDEQGSINEEPFVFINYPTMMGVRRAVVNEYLVKNSRGEFYTQSPVRFEEQFEQVGKRQDGISPKR